MRAATLSIARQLLVADGYAVWANDTDRPEWRIVKSEGVSEAFANRVIHARGDAVSPQRVPFSDPMAVTDISAQPLLKDQLDAYREEGIRSMLVVPMRVGHERAGSLVFYYRATRDFSQVGSAKGQALANLASAAMTSAALYEQERIQNDAAEAARRQAAFLADVGAVLSKSLDYEETWHGRQAGGAGNRRLVHRRHRRSAGEISASPSSMSIRPKWIRARAAATVSRRSRMRSDGVREVIRTGKPMLVKSISPELLALPRTLMKSGSDRDERSASRPIWRCRCVAAAACSAR